MWRNRDPRVRSKHVRSFDGYRGAVSGGEDRFSYLKLVNMSQSRLSQIELAHLPLVQDWRFARDIEPVHKTINERFVNRGFRSEFRSFKPDPDLCTGELAARALFTLSESGDMQEVLGAIDYKQLVESGMAEVEPEFFRDALMLGLTGGAYAPLVEDSESCKYRIGRYLELFPGSDEFEVVAVNPNLSPWFWAEWIDFFFVVIRRDEGWLGVFAASDTD